MTSVNSSGYTNDPNTVVALPSRGPWWSPKTQLAADGGYEPEGYVPGFWSTTWRSQVSGNIDNGWFGNTLAAVTSPFQLIEAKGAPDRIYKALMKFHPEEAKTLSAIESDPSKTGKDWWGALPKGAKDELESYGVSPTNMEYDATTFSRDIRQTLAWAVYNRSVEAGTEKYNDAALLLANLGLGIATDPTTLLSFGSGKVAGGLAKGAVPVSRIGNALSKVGFKTNLAISAGLAGGQSVDSLVNRDYMSERLGIDAGNMTAGEIGLAAFNQAAMAAGTGAALYGAGYFTSMGLSKFSRSTSKSALDLANGLVDNPSVFKTEQSANMLNKIIQGVDLTPTEGGAIFAEVVNAQFGTHFKGSEWDWDSFVAIGVSPTDLSMKIFTEGYSGRQINDILNNASAVIEHAKAANPLTPSDPLDTMGPPVEEIVGPPVPTKPLLPIRALPDFVEAAGYMWGPKGDLIKDPTKAPESSTGGQVEFTTEKGSTYVVRDGKTTRNKAARPEHPGESGPQPESTRTAYLTETQQAQLGMVQATYPQGRVHVVSDLKTGSLAVAFYDGPEAGKIIRNSVVDKPATQPAKGLYPLEIWERSGRKNAEHFGNKIVEVRSSTFSAAPTPAETPVAAEAAKPVTRVALLPEDVPPITPPRQSVVGSGVDNVITTMVLNVTNVDEFDMIIEAYADAMKAKNPKFKFTPDQFDQIKDIQLNFDNARKQASDSFADTTTPNKQIGDGSSAKAPKVYTKEELIAEVHKLTGRKDTLVPRNADVKDVNKLVEIPNIVDRLVWMTGKNWEAKGSAEKLLGDYYGLGIKEIRTMRSAMEKSIPLTGRKKLDRIRIERSTADPAKPYIAEALFVGVDPLKPTKGVKVPKASTEKSPTELADAYVRQRNAAVDKKEADNRLKEVNKAAKAAGKPQKVDPEVEVPGLNREATAAYNQMLKTGDFKGAFDLLNTALVGEGNFLKIRQLSEKTVAAKEALYAAFRNPDEASRTKNVNEAKEYLNQVNKELEKYRQRLFAVSSKKIGDLKISVPLDASQGPLTRAVLGTPDAPSTQFYVEPMSGDSGQAMHRTKMKLDPLFVGMDPSNAASRIDIDYPNGFFYSVGNWINGVTAPWFLQGDAGRLLSTKMPFMQHLINLIAPSSLSNSAEIGSKAITPSLYGGYTRIRAESLAVTMDANQRLAALGIHVDTPEYHDIAMTAKRERQSGKTLSTKYREAVDIYKQGLKSVIDVAGEEGVLVGKVKQSDPTHTHIMFNEEARRDIDGVTDAFHEVNVRAFSRDTSDIHEPTLNSIRTTTIYGSDGKTKAATLGELRDIDPQAADEYLKALASRDRRAPMYDFVHKSMRVRNGLDVTDDRDIIREVSRYTNSGFGRSLNEELLLSPQMSKYIETDMHTVFNDYDRNVRYQFMRQDAVNRFLSNVTGSEVTGITYADAINYFRGIMLDHKVAPDVEINFMFDALIKKEMQINHRSVRKMTDGEALADAGMSALAAPVQTLVAAGSSFTSTLPETVKAIVKALTTASGGTGGTRTFFGSIGRSISLMTKPQKMAGYAGMMQISTHGQVPGIDMPAVNYSGGYLRTKMANLKRPWVAAGAALSTKADSAPRYIANVVKSFAYIPVETTKQIFHLDNLSAANYRIYQGVNMYDMAGVLEQFSKDPDFLTKVQPSETVNRMNEAGLFSKEGKAGLDALIKHNPDILNRYFEFNDLYRAVMDMKTNRKVTDAEAKAASRWYQAYWEAVHRQTDAHTMTIPGPWDVSDPDANPIMNRFMNTFSGYSRWVFGRNFQQNFPNSSMSKIGAMLTYYWAAEVVSLMLRDSMANPELFEKMLDDEDLMEDYMVRGMLRVPLFGQITNGTVEGAVTVQGWFTGQGSSWTRPSMFSGDHYRRVMQELAKAARGEDYDPEVVRKGIPMLNAPIFGGMMKMVSED